MYLELNLVLGEVQRKVEPEAAPVTCHIMFSEFAAVENGYSYLSFYLYHRPLILIYFLSLSFAGSKGGMCFTSFRFLL